MNILKFDLYSNFCYFQDKVNIKSNISFPSIHRPALLGMLGAILGFDGFSKVKNNNSILYIEHLNSIEVGIVLKNTSFEYSKVKTTDSTLLDISNERNRQTLKTEYIINNPSFEIYLKIPDKELFEEIYFRLKNRKYHFEPSLGKSYFFANIKNVEKVSILDKNNLDIIDDDLVFINSLFSQKFLCDLSGEQFTDLFNKKEFTIGRSFSLPISSDSISGIYNNFDAFTFNNFVLFDDIIDNEKFLNINNNVIYFFK